MVIKLETGFGRRGRWPAGGLGVPGVRGAEGEVHGGRGGGRWVRRQPGVRPGTPHADREAKGVWMPSSGPTLGKGGAGGLSRGRGRGEANRLAVA